MYYKIHYGQYFVQGFVILILLIFLKVCFIKKVSRLKYFLID